MAGRSGLSINLEVIESMAAMATLEVPGVASMAPKTFDIRNVVARRSVFKPVHAEIKNGAVVINLYITIKGTANAKKVGEDVQISVKDKVQSMTSNAVTKVNVNITGVDLTENADEE